MNRQKKKAAPPAVQPAATAMRSCPLYGYDHESEQWELWQAKGDVLPVSAFETLHGGGHTYIRSGHYVIDYKGRGTTVHCGNYVDGSISLQFMRDRRDPIRAERCALESILLGRVVPDPEHSAQIRATLRSLTQRLRGA